MRAIGQHSSKTPEWGSAARIGVFARAVIGEIDVDPASSEKWNCVVGAHRFIAKRENGLRTPWVTGAPPPHQLVAKRRVAKAARHTAFLNPPGNKTGTLVAGFWRALATYHELGWISSAVYVGFSVEQLARLQRVGAPSHPLEHATLVPSRRLHYSVRPGVAGEQPGHASFVTLLSTSRAEVDRFVRLGAELGHVTLGDRHRGRR